MIRAFAPLMKESGDGVVINVSSISGFTGSGNNIGYCAAKAALDTMTMSLARVLGPQVRVLCVSPAAVATDFVAGRDRAALEKVAQGTPLNRVVREPLIVVTASEFIDVDLNQALPERGHICTGQSSFVDWALQKGRSPPRARHACRR
jgi:NAD(P)-dependent dehydrogenase (short-subunit alcohol dehydrogenase family)